MPTMAVQKWLESYCADHEGVVGGMVVMPAPPAGALGVAAVWPEGASTRELFAAAKAALAASSPVVSSAGGAEGCPKRPGQVVSLPVQTAKERAAAVALEITATRPEHAQAVLDEVRRVVAGVDFGFASGAYEGATAGTDIAVLLRIQAAVLSCERLPEAATAFASELASAARFDRVCVGMLDGEEVEVVAVSHRGDAPEQAGLLRGVADAMSEAIEQTATITYPAPTEARPHITLAHAELARRQGGLVCTIPLAANGRMFGALTLERAGEEAIAPETVAACEHIACLVGPVLRLHQANARPWHKRLRQAIAGGWGRVAGPGDWLVKGVCAALLAAAGGLLLVPVDYWIGASARMEGAVQRVLVAPVDGFIKQAAFRPGDRVGAEQVLVELAEQDLDLERRKWESELAQHENARHSALARAERAEYVTSEAKAEAARAQLALIEQQLARSRIRAPFDGVVIKGDLAQSLGAPVQRGETLLTVAPAKAFRLIVEVDERDVPDVHAGAEGALALAALPKSEIPFRVARITPMATTRDGRNFFEVEGALNGVPASVQAGLQGVAKIHAGRRSLAWIWTHRLADWLRLTLWSWRI